MSTCQSSFVALSISSNVFPVAFPQLFNCLLDHINSTIIPHRLGAARGKKKLNQKLKMLFPYSCHCYGKLVLVCTCSWRVHQHHSSHPDHLEENSSRIKQINREIKSHTKNAMVRVKRNLDWFWIK